MLSFIIEKEDFEVNCLVCTFQSSQFFDRLSIHFGVVNHIRASALATADRRPPSWNRITDSTHAPPVGNGIGEPHSIVKLRFGSQYICY
jgi:hypothetical protein